MGGVTRSFFFRCGNAAFDARCVEAQPEAGYVEMAQFIWVAFVVISV
jgi:hypothetical protein